MSLQKVFAAAGVLALVIGAAAAPQRTWGSLLLVSYYLIGLGLTGVFFVALNHACGATWDASFRRVPAAMSAVLPFGAVALAGVLICRPALYPWTGGIGHTEGFQGVWLRMPFFLIRAAIYLGLWIWFARAIARRQSVKLSVIFLPVFAITVWLASYDWIMSLEPHWSSTIFAVYNFAGLFSSGLAALILLVVWRREADPDQLHDLGKLLFAFSTFWMYIWFSQYMLIWYANISEESVYFIRRQHQFWQPLFFVNVGLNWGVPFLVLLPTWTKRNAGILAKVAVVVLLGRWLDLYLMIMPPIAGANPPFGIWEVALTLGGLGLFALVFEWAMRQAPFRSAYRS